MSERGLFYSFVFMKCIFLLFLLILGHFAMAQDIAADREIEKIDSLIFL